jgi:DNA mismatch repair ATPase MutS
MQEMIILSNLKAEEYKSFEEIKKIRKDGTEYWNARELSKVLQYKKWENFAKVIDRANELLEMYESKDKKESKTVTQFQLDFTEEPKEDKLREYLDTIDPNYITPIEALNILDKLKKLDKESK